MSVSHGENETRFARDRVLDFLDEMEWSLVTDWVTPEDGWRARLSSANHRRTLSCHKPHGAPYVTFELTLGMTTPATTIGWERLAGAASDHDAGVFFDEDDGDGRLCARLYVSSLNREDVRFHVRNLEFARDAVHEALNEVDEAPSP